MNDRDKIGFMGAINSMMILYNVPALDINTVKIWYSKLEQFEFQDICKAFDTYTNKYSTSPSPADIIRLLPQPTQFTQLPAPKLDKAANKKHSDDMVEYVAKTITPKTDYKAWAKRIIANPKNYPAISLRFANDALAAKNVPI
jgi:outer membrane protein assembly factor BamD (BamD/ComL family)